jgi:uncharacterized HAD superfamily protein
MMSYIIVDLDNCISDDQWRLQTIKWHLNDFGARYKDYHELIPYDEFKNWHLVSCLSSERIIFNTARPERYRRQTMEWLARHAIEFEGLYMRPYSDINVSTVEVKESNLLLICKYTNGDIVVAYDDRQDVIAMYQHYRIRAELHSIYHNRSQSI